MLEGFIIYLIVAVALFFLLFQVTESLWPGLDVTKADVWWNVFMAATVAPAIGVLIFWVFSKVGDAVLDAGQNSERSEFGERITRRKK